MAIRRGRLSLVLVDEDGISASLPLYLSADGARTMDEQVGEAQAVGTLINNLSGAKIQQVIATWDVPPLDDWRASPLAGSDVSLGVLLQFAPLAGACKYGICIPAILDAKLTGSRLNVSDPDVAAFVTHVTLDSGPFVYTDKGGQPLHALVSTFRNTRKHSAAQADASLELI